MQYCRLWRQDLKTVTLLFELDIMTLEHESRHLPIIQDTLEYVMHSAPSHSHEDTPTRVCR